ncbi:MAG: glycosyltransferase family 2 protein [Deltaproteobacteria bacterium]|nr:glycosyltransferase family 2 protein [Deltaproteobacteria bacterium]
MARFILTVQWFFLLYFILQSAGYFLLDIISAIHLRRYMRERSLDRLRQSYWGLEPPISILVPAYNEEATIEASIRSLLQLSYPEYEVIAINDGSRDKTLEVLIRQFSLVPYPEPYPAHLPTKPIRAVYHSTLHFNLRVIDKVKSGKADALNAGINVSRYPLICSIDADSVLQRDSLHRVVQPFLENPSTVASGGTVRVRNGCEVSGGFLTEVGLPRSLLALFQVVEYLRAFLFGRMGWSPLNAMLVISGAFGLFDKETVVAVGGYRTDTLSEDMELVVRLHRQLRLQGKRYRITFVPDPICWTEVPEDLKSLERQRVRWQRGLSESLTMNFDLLCNRKAGTVGWLAFPFTVIFEWLSPLVHVAAYLLMPGLFFLGYISGQAMAAFLVVEIGFGMVLSVSALFLEEISFHVYPKPAHICILFLAALAENFGYRQMHSFWRLIGLYHWASGAKAHWGEMPRKGY